jgi:hypothetical protein
LALASGKIGLWMGVKLSGFWVKKLDTIFIQGFSFGLVKRGF